MKKIVCILILALLYFQRFDYMDLSKYQSKYIEVEIKGEVGKPGVYRLLKATSISDLIQKAKGLKAEADISSINLNKMLMNKDVVVITKKKTIAMISINSADKETLMELPGIGEAMANRIITYRSEHPFQQIEDIMQVKGIKEKLFAKIKDKISL